MGRSKSFNIAKLGVFASLIFLLSFIENFLAPSFALPPGIRLGLANTVVMLFVFRNRYKDCLYLLFLKCSFSFFTRGLTAFLMSFCGSFFSILFIFLFKIIIKNDVIFISIIGAVFHNIGQILMASFIIGSEYVVYYMPILLISGLVVGIINGKLVVYLNDKLKAVKVIL